MGTWQDFLKSYCDFLNKDAELERRVNHRDSFELRDAFFGGHPCLPGFGPYDRATIAYDPSDWASKTGYRESQLAGEDLVDLKVGNEFHITIKLTEDKKFEIHEGDSKRPILACEMTLEVFKWMALGKHKTVWAICHESSKAKQGTKVLGLTDWTTVLEVLGCFVDHAEMNAEIWDFWLNLETA